MICMEASWLLFADIRFSKINSKVYHTMGKKHTVRLQIRNTMDHVMTLYTDWFDSGRLADNSTWSPVINPTESHSTVNIVI